MSLRKFEEMLHVKKFVVSQLVENSICPFRCLIPTDIYEEIERLMQFTGKSKYFLSMLTANDGC